MDSLSKGMAWMALALCVGLGWSAWMVVQGGLISDAESGAAIGVKEETPTGAPVRVEQRKASKETENARAAAQEPFVEVWVFDEKGEPATGVAVSVAAGNSEGEVVTTDAKGRCQVPMHLIEKGSVKWFRAGSDKLGWGQVEYKPGVRQEIVLSRELVRTVPETMPAADVETKAVPAQKDAEQAATAPSTLPSSP